MKIGRRILAAAAALCMAMAWIVSPSSVEKVRAEVFGDYEYKITSGGTVEITKYTGETAKLVVPVEIDGKTVTAIGAGAFIWHDELEELILPDGITSIESEAFSNCIGLTKINIPDGVTSIKYRAFYSCGSLTEINIPDGVTSIGDFAFWGCESLVKINIPKGVTSIGDRAFCFCDSLVEINIPNSVTYIDGGAFYSCTSLREINIPDSTIIIRDATFLCCESLTEITLPNSVASINRSAFYGCESLAEISIPVNVASIEEQAFFNCSSLKDVHYSGTKEQWNNIAIVSDGNEDLLNAAIHCSDGVLSESEKPAKPSEPESPDNPANPDNPDNPSAPDTPASPDNPSTPDNPSSPDKPSVPNSPATPNNPTIPSAPDNPSPPSADVTVTFDAQGGTNVSSIRAAKNGRLSYIPLTYKSGWIFQGWYTGANGAGSMLTLGTVFRQDTAYYAYWTAANRSVTGIGVSISGTVYAGENVYNALVVRAFYSDGTSERVYDYSVSQTVLYSGSNTVAVTYQGFTQNVVVPAGVSGTNAAVRNLSVDYTGGALPAGNYGAFGGLVVKAEYSDGTTREVQGYNLSTHTIVKGNNKVTVSFSGKTADFYVTGYQYSAVHMANIAGATDILVSEDTKLYSVLQNFVPSKSGCYFSGWYLDEACTMKVTAGTEASAGTQVYAKWEKIHNWALNKTKAAVKKGKKVKLSVAGLSSSKITWKSSNKKVAKVSKQGVVTGLKKGTAVITAVTKDGTVMTCTVKVKK